MSQVAISRCENYELENLKIKINETLNHLGGIDSIIKKDAKVFLKINGLGPFAPNLGITTHPTFVQAVIQLLKTRTNNIIIGDNPATKEIIYTLKKTGIYEVIQEEKVSIFDGKNLQIITNPKARVYQNFEVSKEMIDVDVLINLPKLKTHALAYMTVAQKNLFGFIYGLSKAAWHVKASNPLEFGEALNDLYGAILESFKEKTILHLCDGILGLEGDGPSTAGFPKNANVILASFDAVSLDRIALEIVKLDYDKLFINKIAHERGYGIGDLKKISLLGESLKTFKEIEFAPPTNALSIPGLRLLKYKFIRNLVLEYPVIDPNLCIKCGECAKICPPKAMTITPGNFPQVEKIECIRCWCCAEVCPKSAITQSKRPLLGRILIKNRN